MLLIQTCLQHPSSTHLQDFEWLTANRHTFLAKKRAQNYTVFLSNLPVNMQNDTAIQDYFRNIYGGDKIVDGDVALYMPHLEALNAARDALLPKLEHAINLKVVAGKTPTHRTQCCGGKATRSVPAWRRELEGLNREISGIIDVTVAEKESRHTCEDGDAEAGGGTAEARPTRGGVVEDARAAFARKEDRRASVKDSLLTLDLTDGLADGLSTIKDLVVIQEGSARSAAFVTFADLVSANTALQVVHNREPWDMKADIPPRPDLVNWANVGVNNQAKYLGELASLALTTILCIFWTIPVRGGCSRIAARARTSSSEVVPHHVVSFHR